MNTPVKWQMYRYNDPHTCVKQLLGRFPLVMYNVSKAKKKSTINHHAGLIIMGSGGEGSRVSSSQGEKLKYSRSNPPCCSSRSAILVERSLKEACTSTGCGGD
ncbi:hypothetical protein L2E82_10320 [Cichorium intybus]|uniref:Uncharacterized protein n=1 Tax=Cichorium intybus TaxID=13427 RepID=A0ACB9GC89_CICIN|nr:hypothetical protein L2E82_10320 [Cichorium intybus]